MRIQSTFAILSAILLAGPCLEGQTAPSGIVISQVYGGGGNSGATLRNDFIELFNRSSVAIVIDGWSVQYASASGTSWDRTLLSGVVQPGQFYLVQETQGTGGSASLPTPDVSGSINLSATDGKVALVSNSTVLNGTAPSGSSISDFVGYGSADSAEGNPVTALTNTSAAIRLSGGCTDSNNNRTDFSLGSPAPRNSHSPLNLCTPPVLFPKPDLVITALAAPTSGTVGGVLAGTSAVVKNQGAIAAGTFRVGYYLSTIANITPSAVYTGGSCVSPGLPVGSTFTCNVSIAIPSNLSSGTWYLLASADDQNQVDEADESNNLRLSDNGSIKLSGGVSTPQCGVERWSVKTGTDADVKEVNLNEPISTVIANLVSLPVPSNLPGNNRIKPTETTVFVLNAILTQYKLESDDSDYHLVLADPAGRTLIAEVPLPGCVGSGSPFLSAITTARAAFDAQLAATTTFKTANIPVMVRGVGFFDSMHGQTGVAPNGIELHPILNILFAPTITSIGTAGGFPDIAQNDWIEIHGVFAPSNVGPNGLTWDSAPEFTAGKMPTQLSNLRVEVNGKRAYVYYVSETQINVLTPLDAMQGQVSVVVANGTSASPPFTASMHTLAPSLLRFGATPYIAATHADGSLLGPSLMTVPGYTFTPALPGETVVFYGVGFGLPTTNLAEGSSTQAGTLVTAPVFQIGGTTAVVQFAGVVSPGLYQFNVVVPSSVANGDNTVAASYGGFTTPAGSVVFVKR